MGVEVNGEGGGGRADTQLEVAEVRAVKVVEGGTEGLTVGREFKGLGCKVMFARFVIPKVMARAVFVGAFDVEEAQGGMAGGDGFGFGERAVEGDGDGVCVDF